MHPQSFAVRVGALSLFLASCAPGSPVPVPSPIPDSAEVARSDPSHTAYLRFSPGTYRYRLTQTAEVRAIDSLSAVPSTITTQGLLWVEVATKHDSTFQITVSADSISVETQGAIPRRQVTQVVSPMLILSLSISAFGKSIEAQLPDSLCTYGHFVGIARELILPELGFQTESPAKRSYADSSAQQSCQAGTNIQVLTTRRLQDRGKTPPEFDIEQTATLQGVGVLRRDSVAITGSISTRGIVTLMSGERLPAFVETHSDGIITVRLGQSITVFRQVSRQYLRFEAL